MQIVKTDLKPLIRTAAQSPAQFAVLVPHAVSTSSGGQWSSSSGLAKWSYAVEVPTAVSLSFHAVASSLPQSAVLVVRGNSTTTIYRWRDLHRGELWSRIQPGQALQFELTIAEQDRGKVALNIVSLQAGYRAIGAGAVDHPYYRQLLQKRQQSLAVQNAQADAASNTSCITNYQCKLTPGNTPQGAATMGIVIANVVQCTGTLINNVRGDNKPYVLTARHCETGKIGGGNPGAASSVTVYWDAISPCNFALGSLYDPGIATQTGAQTVVEQQDAWLILLDANPVVADARFAGFDASGGVVQGGYTVHHAKGADKQITSWFGPALSLNQRSAGGVTYLANFLETVNAAGNIAPGASGGGLFDQNNHLVGSLTYGRTTVDPSGYESCPAGNLAAPNGNNGTADFTALSAVWNSTADSTSTTGNATLKSILDSSNTGILVVPGMHAANIQFSASVVTATNATPVELLWNAQSAIQCTATGGVAGDGWTGSLSAGGSQTVTETTTGNATYALICNYPDGHSSTNSVTVDWVGPTPSMRFTAPANALYGQWATRPLQLTWTSNVAPCSISGGGVSLGNLAASGATAVTQAVAGEITYTLTCGPANDQGVAIVHVNYVTPSVTLQATGTDRILGQTFELQWVAYADTCVPSGGAPGDGWATTSFGPQGGNANGGPTGWFVPSVTTLGIYTYTLTCSSGPISLQQSVTVTFEDNAPYVNASLRNASVIYSDSPADYLTLDYISNMSSCVVDTDPAIQYLYNDSFGGHADIQAQNSLMLAPPAPGSYQISVTCALLGANPVNVTSTPITLTVLPPPPPTATISVTPSSVVSGQTFTISYSSTNASNCAQSGGFTGFWGSSDMVYNEPPTGIVTGNTMDTGQYTFTISCQSIDPGQANASAQTTLTVSAQSSSSSSDTGSGNAGTGSNSSHGGGSVELIDLSALTLLLLLRWRGMYRPVRIRMRRAIHTCGPTAR